MNTDNAIVVSGLTKSFGKLPVLKGIDLTVKRGTMLALLGPNGAGKTTTIRILSTLLQPDGGHALVNNYSILAQPRKVRESIGLTGQFAAVDEYLTGLDNLEMMGRLYHLSTKDSRERARELLEQFDLVEAANRKVKTYSGGMRRRLDLALSLMATPPIIFLDEPTTGLDPRSRLAMWDIIQKLVESNATILLTTQYLEEADQLADRIAVIDDGRVIAEGTSDELKNKVGREKIELTVYSEREHERRTISLSTDGSVDEVKRILDRVGMEEGIKIESFSLHKPTLDDVFMQLTGHKVAEDHENNKPK